MQPGTKSLRFSSIVPQGETQTWLTIRNPGFDGNTLLPLGLTLNQASLTVNKAAPLDFLQDWVGVGLVKTNPMDVTEGDKLTVTLTFDEVTEPTALSFLNSAQNGYYEGGIVVQPGTKKVTLTSIVPRGETQTWLTVRNPSFNGVSPLPLGLQLDKTLLTVEKATPLDLLPDWTKTKFVRNFREVLTNEGLEAAPIYDLGYNGRPARSLQYSGELEYAKLHLPTAPVFHPYNPTYALPDDRFAPSFSLNVKLPTGYNNLAFAPLALSRLLEQKDPNSIEYFLVVQDVPWDLTAAPLEYRPQSWLDPDAPFQTNEGYGKEFPAVNVGVFSREGTDAPIIDGQTPGALLHAKNQVVVHNGRAFIPHVPDIETNDKALDFRMRAENGEILKAEEEQNDRGWLDTFLLTFARTGRLAELTEKEQLRVTRDLGWKAEDSTRFGKEEIVVSSGDCFKLGNFKTDASQVLWSLTEDLTSGKIAVVKHVFLTSIDNALFEDILKRPKVKTYEDMQQELRTEDMRGNRIPLRGGGTLADELDIPLR
ncbi:MAG: hypothetical protein HYX35_05680 [Proteobacteria bacterium]|nr:hypothetical protein [Pseudomonadota bacterium]